LNASLLSRVKAPAQGGKAGGSKLPEVEYTKVVQYLAALPKIFLPTANTFV
jgi:hypothetical protein